jgi:NADPH2:quinone reductase
LTIVASGGYAEVVTADAALVAALGEAGFEVGAALPSNSTTAFLVLERVARLERGESVRVHAAAGGVGSQLGQVARLLGAGRVVGAVGRSEDPGGEGVRLRRSRPARRGRRHR